MKDWIVTYFIIHFSLAFIALWVELINYRYLRVRNFVLSAIWGPIYFFIAVGDLDKIVIDLRKKDLK